MSSFHGPSSYTTRSGGVHTSWRQLPWRPHQTRKPSRTRCSNWDTMKGRYFWDPTLWTTLPEVSAPTPLFLGYRSSNHENVRYTTDIGMKIGQHSWVGRNHRREFLLNPVRNCLECFGIFEGLQARGDAHTLCLDAVRQMIGNPRIQVAKGTKSSLLRSPHYCIQFSQP